MNGQVIGAKERSGGHMPAIYWTARPNHWAQVRERSNPTRVNKHISTCNLSVPINDPAVQRNGAVHLHALEYVSDPAGTRIRSV